MVKLLVVSNTVATVWQIRFCFRELSEIWFRSPSAHDVDDEQKTNYLAHITYPLRLAVAMVCFM